VIFNRGDYVQTLFNTGCLGYDTLFGIVITSGPRCFEVMWESGIVNRGRQDNPRQIKPVTELDLYKIARSKLATMKPLRAPKTGKEG